MFLYGVVSTWDDDITANGVLEAINNMAPNTKKVSFYINSPGGDLFEAKAIQSNIKRLKCETVAIVDGLCASCATVIALGCDRVEMTKGSYFMIHEASTCAYGTKKDMIKTAETLEGIEESIVSDYAEKTGIDPADIKQMMEDETWLSAEEAVEKGFADSIVAEQKEEKSDEVGHVSNANRLKLLMI